MGILKKIFRSKTKELEQKVLEQGNELMKLWHMVYGMHGLESTIKKLSRYIESGISLDNIDLPKDAEQKLIIREAFIRIIQNTEEEMDNIKEKPISIKVIVDYERVKVVKEKHLF